MRWPLVPLLPNCVPREHIHGPYDINVDNRHVFLQLPRCCPCNALISAHRYESHHNPLRWWFSRLASKLPHSPSPLTLSSLDLPSSTPARMKGLFHRGLYNFISCGLSRAIIVPRYVILLGAYLGSHCLRLCANDLNLHVYSVLSITWSLAAPYIQLMKWSQSGISKHCLLGVSHIILSFSRSWCTFCDVTSIISIIWRSIWLAVHAFAYMVYVCVHQLLLFATLNSGSFNGISNLSFCRTLVKYFSWSFPSIVFMGMALVRLFSPWYCVCLA